MTEKNTVLSENWLKNFDKDDQDVIMKVIIRFFKNFLMTISVNSRKYLKPVEKTWGILIVIKFLKTFFTDCLEILGTFSFIVECQSMNIVIRS